LVADTHGVNGRVGVQRRGISSSVRDTTSGAQTFVCPTWCTADHARWDSASRQVCESDPVVLCYDDAAKPVRGQLHQTLYGDGGVDRPLVTIEGGSHDMFGVNPDQLSMLIGQLHAVEGLLAVEQARRRG
jgi:hypothetical protein